MWDHSCGLGRDPKSPDGRTDGQFWESSSTEVENRMCGWITKIVQDMYFLSHLQDTGPEKVSKGAKNEVERGSKMH